jgi:SAM-dependent methyltransferase
MSYDSYRKTLVHSFRQHYEGRADVWSSDPALREVGRLALRQLTDPGATVLDIGTGRGQDAELFCAAGHFVTGIDLVDTSEARRIEAVYPRHFRYLIGDIGDVRIACGSFDLILDNGCFHHQQAGSQLPYLRRLQSLLKPTGTLVISVFTRDREGDPSKLWVAADGRVTHVLCASDLMALLRDSGLNATRSLRVRRYDGNLNFYLVIEAKPQCT